MVKQSSALTNGTLCGREHGMKQVSDKIWNLRRSARRQAFATRIGAEWAVHRSVTFRRVAPWALVWDEVTARAPGI